MASLRDYYVLIKPGIVYGNALHALAGIFIAYKFGWSWETAIGALTGTSLLIASACIVNNYIDRFEDAKMARTKKRPLATGAIPVRTALVIAISSFVVGVGILLMTTNMLTVILGLIAYISYVFAYTLMKRVSSLNTIIGTIPGALPGVAGYVAFSGQMDITAWLIFTVLALWQLPHFYAIGIRRRDDYSKTEFKFITASLSQQKLWLLINGLIIVYVTALVCLVVLTMNWVFVLVAWLAGSWWIWIGLQRPVELTAWAKKVFGGSLILMMVFMFVAFGNFVLEKLS